MQAHIAGAVAVLVACGVLGVAAVCFLARREDRRHACWLGRRPVQLQVAPVPEPPPAVRGPETTVSRLWLCTGCSWAWPLAALFCNTCGRSRAAAREGRDIRYRRETT